jgi:thymidylate synthase (FAD)
MLLWKLLENLEERKMNALEPKVTLLTWTEYPLETVYSVWEASKTENRLRYPIEIKKSVPAEKVEGLFRAVIAQHIPIGEHVDMVFVMENVSISWREQAVRHRIGTTPSPERLGIDYAMMSTIPELAQSSWWSQSMRIQNMGNFVSEGNYRTPKTVSSNPLALETYKEVMKNIENGYNRLVQLGVPMEDARDLIPLGATHRISWKMNISALQHIVSKRGCWILQGGIWQPVIEGMISECAAKIHPIFRELVTPPCIEGNSFRGCVYMEECRRRLDYSDALPPCPLHLNYHVSESSSLKTHPPMETEMHERAKKYKYFWGRDPYTGKRIA